MTLAEIADHEIHDNQLSAQSVRCLGRAPLELPYQPNFGMSGVTTTMSLKILTTNSQSPLVFP